MAQFYVETNETQQLQDALESIKSLGYLAIYRDFYRYYREVLKRRYAEVSASTEYSEAWKGTRQKSSGQIRGEGAKWGQDSGALYSDLTQKVKIRSQGITISSDLEYASYILDLMRFKSKFAPDDILSMDEADLAEMELIIERRVIQAVDTSLAKVGNR